MRIPSTAGVPAWGAGPADPALPTTLSTAGVPGFGGLGLTSMIDDDMATAGTAVTAVHPRGASWPGTDPTAGMLLSTDNTMTTHSGGGGGGGATSNKRRRQTVHGGGGAASSAEPTPSGGALPLSAVVGTAAAGAVAGMLAGLPQPGLKRVHQLHNAWAQSQLNQLMAGQACLVAGMVLLVPDPTAAGQPAGQLQWAVMVADLAELPMEVADGLRLPAQAPERGPRLPFRLAVSPPASLFRAILLGP